MDFSTENMTSSNTQDKLKNATEKSPFDSKEISPLGISRYGRTRKPKISQDFCSIDDIIDNNDDDEVKDNNQDGDFSVKEFKLPTKTFNRLKSPLTNGAQTPIKEAPAKPKYRTTQNNNSEIMHITGDSNTTQNNNSEIVHVTGDSEINYSNVCKPENLQKSRKFFKTSIEDTKLPVIKHIYVTKEKIPEIKDKKLSEELKPILSEEIFQNPPIDISEVFKIISNKSHDLELEANPKQNTKSVVKTYSNKRKSFKRPSTLIESFGLPDEPIVPINKESVVQPLRISEIDVEIVKPESVNLINRELVDTLWKISASENDYMCQNDSDMLIPPTFDVRGRITPVENNIDENIHYTKNTSINKNIKVSENKTNIITPIEKTYYTNSTGNKNQNDNKILKTCTEENIISNTSHELKTFMKKRMSNMNTNFNRFSKKNENSTLLNFHNISNIETSHEALKPIVKTENNFSLNVELQDADIPKKSICTLVYETKSNNIIKHEDKDVPNDNKEKNVEENTSMDTCDIEDHISVSLINRDEIENNSVHINSSIDINKLKNQINSRFEIIKSEKKLLEDQENKCDVDTASATGNEGEAILDAKKDSNFVSTSPTTEAEKRQYELGDLMWAKVGRYPYWPCLITEEPMSKEYKRSSYRTVLNYHVRFFADNGRRSWIAEKNLLPYDTDLSKVQKETKHEVIVPLQKSRSYKYWMMGIREADSVKGKLKKEKLQFFNKMILSKRLSKKKERLREVINKKRIRKINLKARNMKHKNAKKISKAEGSNKLKEEILENLKDMVAGDDYSKRITRSLHKRNVTKSIKKTGKSIDKIGNKYINHVKKVDDYSKKHDSLSNSSYSDDEVSSKSSASLTLEYQTALYKRNNLFKGISRDRVCQICEKPNKVVKCKGRCNGYYHMSCASKSVKETNSFNTSVNMQEIQLSTSETKDRDKKIKQIKNDTLDKNVKIVEDVEYAEIKNEQDLNEEEIYDAVFSKRTTRSSYQKIELENKEIKNDQKEKTLENLGYRRKTRNSEITKIETIKQEKMYYNASIQCRRVTRSSNQEEEIKTEMEYDTERFPTPNRRLTRSCGQEADIIKSEVEDETFFIQNRRITRSSSQELEIASTGIKETDVSNYLKKNNCTMEKSVNRNHTLKKKETESEEKGDINFFNEHNKKGLTKECDSNKTRPSALEQNIKNRRKNRKLLNPIAKLLDNQIIEETAQENSKQIILNKNAELKHNHIVSENKLKDEIDQIISISDYNTFKNDNNDNKKIIKTRESIKNSNVKIVNIKSRKKSINSPTLTLDNDPEFEKLPLHIRIDHKMEEIMQKVDRNPLYADSTTDYTSSEESALDLLSPKGKKMKDYLEPNVKQELELPNNNHSKIVSEGDLDKGLIKEFKAKNEFQSEVDFKCLECLEDIDHACFVCHKEIAKSGSNIRQKCSLFPCGKFYHPKCLKIWPQTQWSVISTTKHKQSNTNLDTFVCPVHVCHTCVSDDPRAAIPRCTSDKVVKCLRCPATYHNSAYCVPAGTEILSSTQIICPRHLIPNRIVKQALPIINTTWCFICSEGGNLICCEMCPTSVHAECLDINFTEDDTFICEDCETGRFPLYDEIVWVKLGHYKWWPAVILFPNEVPDKVRIVKHKRGEFVVRFFGTHDHYWIGRGRVFLFQEGDSGEATTKKKLQKVDALFLKSIQEATEAHAIKKEFKQTITEEAAVKLKYKPPPYIKIKMNRPVGNVRQFDGNISNTTPCECDPKKKNPCGADSDCLNRLLLTECNPEVCPAGEKCQNQNFEKRYYPSLVPYRTETRGWGLKSLESIKKGQFIIEYVGEMIDEQEYQRRIKKMHEQKEENYYFLTIDKDRMLDAGPKGNVARFMNHSCQPNCETQKWTVNGDTRVGLFAVNDISANTELTFNYNLECVGKEKKICKCGAPICSGYIGVKVKQEESHKKSKSKAKHKKKKNFTAIPAEPTNHDLCFICGQMGKVSPCNNKICTKHYHLKCVNLKTWPDNKWVCPWHNCNICTKRTIRCCVKCINSYCPVHSEGNVRYDKLLGFICSEHDPNKADTQEIEIENSKKKDMGFLKITEENDVTSTTCDELDHNICEELKNCKESQEIAQPKECELTPRKLSDNLDIVTSTPIKFVNDNTVDDIISQHFDDLQPNADDQQTRKRGRPKKSLGEAEQINAKRIKLDEKAGNLENENELKLATEIALSSPAPLRNLRTTKVVNYGGFSEKLIAAQRKLENNLPIRKRSIVRCETVL